jgi:hypothetical protein
MTEFTKSALTIFERLIGTIQTELAEERVSHFCEREARRAAYVVENMIETLPAITDAGALIINLEAIAALCSVINEWFTDAGSMCIECIASEAADVEREQLVRERRHKRKAEAQKKVA